MQTSESPQSFFLLFYHQTIVKSNKRIKDFVVCYKETAAEEYRRFAEIAIEASAKLSGIEKTELINRYKAEYSEGTQTNFTDNAAIDEITADYAGRLVREIDTFKKLADADMTLAQRFIASVKEFIEKVKTTFSKDKSKADTASLEKYGATVAELEAAVKTYDGMINTTEMAVKSGNAGIENTAETEQGGERKYSIKENAKGKYVQADRKIVKGNNPKEWGKSVEKFINDKIRRGEDVQVFADNGDILTITEDSAGKSKFRNYVIRPDGTKTRMTDAEYLTKLNAESHIDELSEISKKGKKDIPDYKRHDFAKDGFNYRTAYFQDGDGKYYKLTISVGKNGEINTVYNVGKIEEAQFPLMAHRPDTKSAGGNKASFTNSIPETPSKSNPQNSEKTGDLLSTNYKAREDEVRRGEDPSTTLRSAQDDKGNTTQRFAQETAKDDGTERGETKPKKTNVRFKRLDANAKQTKETEPDAEKEQTSQESSYIDEAGIDKYFEENAERAKVIREKEISEAEKK